MRSLFHSLSIGLACAVGWEIGKRFAKLFGFCLLFATPLKAQLVYGDPRGYYVYVDTTGRKVEPSRPWVERYYPPMQYWLWWQETAHCQRIPTKMKDFTRYKFYKVNSHWFGLVNTFAGYTLTKEGMFFVGRPYVDSKILWVHEFTHALMELAGEPPGHPEKRFGKTGCGIRYPGVDPAVPDTGQSAPSP